MNLEEWQKAYAPAYRKVVGDKTFQAALEFLHNQKIDEIIYLSRKDIKENSEQILGELQSFFRHEQDLMNLHAKKEFTLPVEEESSYISPEEEAAHEEVREQFKPKRK